MSRLHFGVLNPVPYTYGSHRNTREVAEILEAKYGILEKFADDNLKQIKALLQGQAARYTAMTMRGQEPDLQPAFDAIQKMFRQYILTKKLDGRVRGVPTKASLLGINHRLKHPYAKRPPRQSFFDTGLYINAVKVWVERT